MQTREASLIELRASDDGTATIEGRAVPYGRTSDLGGVRETFRPGSVDPGDLIGAPILWQHDRAEVIGVIEHAENRDDGAHFRAQLIPTARGRDAIIALRAKAVTGLSIGFETVEDVWLTRDHVERARVRVREVSVATIPAYPDAEVLAVRNQEKESPVETTTPEVPQVDLSGLATREDLTALESRMTATLQVTEPVPPLDVRDAFTRLVIEHGRSPHVRALADMVSAGNPGLTSTARTSKDVLDLFDATRYFVSRVASMDFPESGITHTLPKKTQRSTVGAGTGEKKEAPSRAITTGVDTFTGEWYKGALDIGYELIRTSSPGAVALAVEDMLEEAAAHSEAVFVAAVEAAATATGAPINFTSYAAFIASIRGAVRSIRAATRNVSPQFALTSDSWDKLLTFVDTSDRRQFATIGSSNADGSANLDSVVMTVGGITFFESPESTVDVGFNSVSLKKAELAPLTIAADNVALIGRDIGVLGNIMAIPRVPAGIKKFAAAAAAASK